MPYPRKAPKPLGMHETLLLPTSTHGKQFDRASRAELADAGRKTGSAAVLQASNLKAAIDAYMHLARANERAVNDTAEKQALTSWLVTLNIWHANDTIQLEHRGEHWDQTSSKRCNTV